MRTALGAGPMDVMVPGAVAVHDAHFLARPPVARVYAMRVPSGDHSGSREGDASVVSCVAPVPSALIVQIWPARSKAILPFPPG